MESEDRELIFVEILFSDIVLFLVLFISYFIEVCDVDFCFYL